MYAIYVPAYTTAPLAGGRWASKVDPGKSLLADFRSMPQCAETFRTVDARPSYHAQGSTHPMANVSRTILIVEDDPGARFALEALVASYGYTVRSAANGQDTLSVAAASEFEGVLLDLLLPDMNGLEVLKQLRLLHPTVPILIISGYDQFKAQALASGAQGFLLKPLDAVRLRDLMLDWFGAP